MYILDKVLDDNFLQVLVGLIAPDAKPGDTLVTILTSLADKEMDIVGILMKLLDKYTLT